MKINNIVVEIKTGLPNHSGRTTTVTAVADEGECLNIEETIRLIDGEIRAAWNKEQSTRVVEPSLAPNAPVNEPLEKVCADVVKRGRGRPPKAQVPEVPTPAAQEDEFVWVDIVEAKDISAVDDILG
jgi:hypothetical protein